MDDIDASSSSMSTNGQQQSMATVSPENDPETASRMSSIATTSPTAPVIVGDPRDDGDYDDDREGLLYYTDGDGEYKYLFFFCFSNYVMSFLSFFFFCDNCSLIASLPKSSMAKIFFWIAISPLKYFLGFLAKTKAIFFQVSVWTFELSLFQPI